MSGAFTAIQSTSGMRPWAAKANRFAHFHKHTFSHTIKLSHSLICSFISQTFSNNLSERKGSRSHGQDWSGAKGCLRYQSWRNLKFIIKKERENSRIYTSYKCLSCQTCVFSSLAGTFMCFLHCCILGPRAVPATQEVLRKCLLHKRMDRHLCLKSTKTRGYLGGENTNPRS